MAAAALALAQPRLNGGGASTRIVSAPSASTACRPSAPLATSSSYSHFKPHQQQARRQQQQVRGAALVGRAKKEDEERALQELAKQVDSKDIWENETLSAVAQVGLVVAAVIVGGLFFTVLGRPVIDYTLDAFPKQ